MARKFDTTAIASTVKAPISKRSLTHINTAWDELGEDIVKGLLGTYTTNDVVVLYGCVVTANIPGTSSVTAGAIFYNGRIYKVDANASISTPSNTLVWSIIETTITGDPATFSDGSSEDFHIIEKFRLTNAATGTGIADYNGATVKAITRSQNIAAGVNANIYGRSVTISFLVDPGAYTVGTTIFTIPSNLRKSVNIGATLGCQAYQGGGSSTQYNLSTAYSYNTATGAVVLALDMPPTTNVVIGQFTYYLD